MAFRIADIPIPPNIPGNYLPVALPAWQNNDVSFSRILFPSDTSAPLKIVSADDLRSGANLGDDAGQTALGPETQVREFAELPGILKDRGTEQEELVLVVIDTGIAFWNPAFRRDPSDPDTCVFHKMGYMTLDTNTKHPMIEVQRLERDKILDTCRQPVYPGAQQDIVEDLASQFPDSAYANGLHGDSFSHGTAMADRLLRDCLKAGKQFKAIGLELPFSAYADISGATLQAVLPRALAAADDMAYEIVQPDHTIQPEAKPIVICVLSYGATGAPLGETGAIQTALDFWTEGQLFLPMGNHLQDRLHARLSNDQSVGWMLQYDDSSMNTVEITGTGAVPELCLVDPTGAEHQIPGDLQKLSLLTIGGNVVGAALTMPEQEGWKMTLTLSGTSFSPKRPAAPAGEWTIKHLGKAEAQELSLWILRDEPIPVKSKSKTWRQSYFVDPNYKERDAQGQYLLKDEEPTVTSIRRNGSVSLFGSLKARAPQVQVIGADENAGGVTRSAYYSGRFAVAGEEPSQVKLVDERKPTSGTRCLGNGSARTYLVSGTSVAAAIAAGEAALHCQPKGPAPESA